MKNIIYIALITSLFACRTTIDISKYPKPVFAKENYKIDTNVNVSLSILQSAYSKTSEAFVFRGGRLFKNRKVVHSVILIQHEKGNFLFDTGLGINAEKQFKNNFNFLLRQLFKYKEHFPVKIQLDSLKFDTDSLGFILISHLHWDHASGIKDFPNTPIWTSREEYTHAFSEQAKPPGFIKDQYNGDSVTWKLLDMDTIPYYNFDKSLDLFGDGTIVLVELPGHTLGSLGMFVNLPSGKIYFIVGDLTWAEEGIKHPSEKFSIPRRIVDADREKTKENLVKAKHLWNYKSDIFILPIHDFKVQQGIAHFPKVER